MKFDSKDYFFSYVIEMTDYLISHGYKPITVAINPSSMKKFALFNKDERMNKLIDMHLEERRRLKVSR